MTIIVCPALTVHLHKIIPVGAGLGGGSSDAAFMLRGISDLFDLSVADEKLEEYASRLGSDCAFFIRNLPVLASERGNIFRDLRLSLDDYYLALICPPVHISTSEAYSRVIPAVPAETPERIVQLPVKEWKEELKNDFEKSIFPLYPEIAGIKDKLYSMGALYASMSGSGSSVFGIFKEMPSVSHEFPDCFHWCGPLMESTETSEIHRLPLLTTDLLTLIRPSLQSLSSPFLLPLPAPILSYLQRENR